MYQKVGLIRVKGLPMHRMSEYQFQSDVVEQKAASAIFRHTARRAAASENKPRVLMVGMHLTKTRGGITTLTSAILNSTLRHDFDFIYLASQAEDFGKFRKVLLALGAALRFAGVCVLKRPDLVYIHVGSNASLYR